MPDSVRHQLEDCERDLIEIQLRLESDYQHVAAERVEHKELAGTGGLVADIDSKIEKLDGLSRDLALCMRTRIAAWHVLSLYPVEPHLKSARGASIERGIESMQRLELVFRREADEDISSVQSIWNSEATVEERRAKLYRRSNAIVEALTKRVQDGQESLARSTARLHEDAKPTRIFLEFKNGAVVGARQAA